MKLLKSIAIIALPIVLFIGCSYGNKPNVNKNGELKIKVDFHCDHGKARIEEGLKKIDGVVSVSADVKTQIVTVVYDESKLNKDKIVAAIESVGHKTEFTKPETKVKSGCSHEEGHNHNDPNHKH